MAYDTHIFFDRLCLYPYGGSRKGKLRTYLNIIIVFFISGIWHGAGIGFIVWGLFHGFYNVLTRIVKKLCENFNREQNLIKVNTLRIVGWVTTFMFVNLTWIFFRATRFSDAIMMYQALISGKFEGVDAHILGAFDTPIVQVFNIITKSGALSTTKAMAIYYTISFIIIFMSNVKFLSSKFKPNALNMVAIILLAVTCIVNLTGESIFLYFNF